MSLSHAILALIAKKPKTGYEIAKEIERSVNFFWAATHQQIYKNLKELNEKDWVTFKSVKQEEKPDKKIYSITATGRKELEDWIKQDNIREPHKDSFLIKLFCADLVDPDILLQNLLSQKKSRKQKLSEYQNIQKKYFAKPKKHSTEMTFQFLTLRRGLLAEKAWLKWCDEVEASLRGLVKKNAQEAR